MDCLKNFIGVRGGGGADPESRLYINDLPGITLAELSALNNSDQTNWQALWASVQTRAAKVFTTQFTNYMNAKYKLKKTTEQYFTSNVPDMTTTYAPVSGQLRGLFMDCYIYKSAFHYIPIDVVNVYFPNANSFTLNIYEVENGNTLTAEPLWSSGAIVGTVGWNRVFVGKKFYNNRTIFIAYDATEITSQSIPLNGVDLNPLMLNLRAFFNHVFIGGKTYQDGQFLDQAEEAFGISTTLGLKCDYDNLVCNNRFDLALAFWYLLGAELMTERLYSDRINRYTTVDIDMARELNRAFREAFANEMQTYVSSIDLKTDWCIECDAPIIRVERLP